MRVKAQHEKSFIVLFITLFLVMAGFGLIIPIMPFFIKKLGGNATIIGVFMATYSVMQFLFSPYWGRLSDGIGRRPVLLIGLFGYGVSFIAFGLANQLWMMFVIRIISGVLSTAALPTTMAYIADITKGEERAASMGMMGAAMGAGMIFGPALGGWLGHFDFALPFFAAGGLALVNLLFAFFLLPESLTKRVEAEQKARVMIGREVLKNPLLLLFIVGFILNFIMAMFESTFALYAADRAGVGPKEMGTLFAVLGVIGIVIQGGLIGKLSARFGDAGLIKAGILIMAVGMLSILLAPNLFFMILTTAILNIGSSLMGPTSSSLLTRNATGGQGNTLGLWQSFASLGRIIGPVAGGLLYGVNINIPYLLGGVALLLMLLATGHSISKFEKMSDA